MGETSFYINERIDFDRIVQLVNNVFPDSQTSSALVLWVEYLDDKFETAILWVDKNGEIPFTSSHLKELFNN